MIRTLALLGFAGLVACVDQSVPGHAKPGVPVAVTLDAKPLGGGVYELDLTGRALADLRDFTLELALSPGVTVIQGDTRAAYGAVTSGFSATLVTRVQAGGEAAIVGGARVPGGTRTAGVTIGAAAQRKPAPPRVVTTPYGSVTEARDP
jgi:hypothetical protein